MVISFHFVIFYLALSLKEKSNTVYHKVFVDFTVRKKPKKKTLESENLVVKESPATKLQSPEFSPGSGWWKNQRMIATPTLHKSVICLWLCALLTCCIQVAKIFCERCVFYFQISLTYQLTSLTPSLSDVSTNTK